MNSKTKSNDSKQHDKRKNPGAAEAWRASKKARNEAQRKAKGVFRGIIVNGANEPVAS